MGNVFVTNHNKFDHTDRYDGEDFVFPPDVPVQLTEDAARHMFGLGLVDKTAVLQRLGWAFDPRDPNFAENPDGVQKLARFVFEEAVTVSRSSLHAAAQPEIA